ncbi:unnamed protein product [Mortierella alpina]
MDSPNSVASTTKKPSSETVTYSPPKSTAPSGPDPDTSTRQVPPRTTPLPRSSGGYTTTTMSSPPTADPSVTSNPEPTTGNPKTTETEPATTTTERPETTATITTTTDVVSTTAATSADTTSDRPATTESTSPRTSGNVVTITSSPPYTTRYITTVSIITIKTLVPKPTMISGSGTTIFIPWTTTFETPTVIPDPNQPPPGGVTNSNDKKTMSPWQVMLIIAACLIVAAAGGAVLLIGRIKKRRRERDAQQHFTFQEQQHPHQKEVMFGIGRGDESVMESSVTDASGAISNRTLISPAEGGGGGGDGGSDGGGGVFNTGGMREGMLRGWMDRFRSWTPWDGHRAYHGPAHPSGVGHGAAGRLWLMDEDAELGANDHTLADMRPVSYQNEDCAGGVAPTHQRQYPQPQHQSYQDIARQARQGSPGQAAYPRPPLSQSSRMSSASATTAHSNHNSNEHAPGGTNTSASSSPLLLHPLLQERPSIGSDLVVGRGTVSHRASLDNNVLASNNPRNSIYVDPTTLEPHSMCEHIRKAPQALPDSGNQLSRVADAGEGQEEESEQMGRAPEDSDVVEATATPIPDMTLESEGEVGEAALKPCTVVKPTGGSETRRSSVGQVQAAAPAVNEAPMNVVMATRQQGNSVHESEPDDVFYMCPESPIGTIAPDDSRIK